MAILEWPASLCVNRATWGIESNTETFTSPLNKTTQTLERPGARWNVTLEFPPMSREKRRALEAFLAALGGRSGRFRVWPMGRTNDTLPALVTGYSGPSNRMVGLVGFVPGAAAIAPGSYLEINGELKIVVDSTVADENGKEFVTIAPPFRNYPAEGTTVTTVKPMATFMLTEDAYSVGIVPGNFTDPVTLSGVEIF